MCVESYNGNSLSLTESDHSTYYLQVSNFAVIFNVAVAQCQSENDLDCDDQTEDDLCSEDDGAGAASV